jgi:hypothetical protein
MQRFTPMIAGLTGFVATALAILIHAAANGAAPFA